MRGSGLLLLGVLLQLDLTVWEYTVMASFWAMGMQVRKLGGQCVAPGQGR